MIKEAIQKPEINFWLGLIIPFVGIAIAWGTLTTRVDHIEKMTVGLQNKQQVQIDNQLIVNEEIKIRLAEIQKDLIYIRAVVDKNERYNLTE